MPCIPLNILKLNILAFRLSSRKFTHVISLQESSPVLYKEEKRRRLSQPQSRNCRRSLRFVEYYFISEFFNSDFNGLQQLTCVAII